ncbi:MAG: sugar phosphate isomerase/epimerase [Deltaproteobacteria bacterium]|nr:sugar phosphate isomerase/epimerase [Deltaproteobacteria bacterium]
MRLGMHTYSLYHHGVAEDWAGFTLPWERQITLFEMMDYIKKLGLEGLHLDAKAFDEMDQSYFARVKQYAASNDLYLEYNFALKSGHYDSSVQHDIEAGIAIAHSIGADITKIGMNLKRPQPVAASKFHPKVMKQLESVVKKVSIAIPFMEKTGVKLALENHTDAFSQEVLWVLDQINHPMVGACIDTVNALHVTEDPITAVENLAPRAFTNHFRDNKIVIQPWGLKITGAALGDGDLDMKRAYELISQNPGVQRINIELDLDCPINDMEKALEMERSALIRSIAYCRDVLGIKANNT